MAKYLPVGENLMLYGNVSECPKSLIIGFIFSASFTSS